MAFQKIWQNLPAETRELFERSAQLIELKRGQFVYRTDEMPQGIYFVSRGLVGLVVVGSSGKDHLLRFFREGQFFGHRSLFSQEPYHGSAVALEPTYLKLVPEKVILSALKIQPELYREVVLTLARELRRCELQHVMILENQVLSRTAQALVYLKDLHPDHNWTRQEIADFCASTNSTIIKALAELESLGLIRQSGRTIAILDRKGLISLQDEMHA